MAGILWAHMGAISCIVLNPDLTSEAIVGRPVDEATVD